MAIQLSITSPAMDNSGFLVMAAGAKLYVKGLIKEE